MHLEAGWNHSHWDVIEPARNDEVPETKKLVESEFEWEQIGPGFPNIEDMSMLIHSLLNKKKIKPDEDKRLVHSKTFWGWKSENVSY